MNKSYSKIRHIQESNILLEQRRLKNKPFLNEGYDEGYDEEPTVKTYKQGTNLYKVENNKYFSSVDNGKTWTVQTDPTKIKEIQTFISSQNTVTTTTTLQPTQTGTTSQPTQVSGNDVRSDGKYYDEEEGEWKSLY